jgi:hypothetical protein
VTSLDAGKPSGASVQGRVVLAWDRSREGWVGREQRRHRRYEVAGVEGSLLLSHDARILNMSLTGLLVESNSPLRLGTRTVLRVAQPAGELRFDANVKWCQLVGTSRDGSGAARPVYHAGIDFRETLDERARAVLSFLESPVIDELERRLAGRFQPPEPIAAELTSGEPFEVCKLSLSGLLLRTERPPAFGSEVELEIDTPLGVVHGRAAVRNLERRPAAGASADDGPWLVGIELVRLDADGRQTLTRYIETLLD